MKLYKYLFPIAAALFFVYGCEDAIEVELDPADRLFTVDAWLDNTTQDQEVILSWSQNYFDSSYVQKIVDAEVTLINSNGASMQFDHQGEGRYTYSIVNENKIGQVGDLFSLSIAHDGKTYTAQSEMNRVPQLDSIMQEFRDDPFADDGIYCNFFATDPPGAGDTYWIKTFKDGRYLNQPQEINIAWDSTFDGGVEVEAGEVFIQPIQEFNNEVNPDFSPIPWLPGEVITVEIHSITNEAFAFMELFRDQLLNGFNGIFAEPLANTPTNIVSSDGSKTLGFFNTAAVSTLSDTIR